MNLLDSLHALLFVADAPVGSERLAATLGITEGQVEQGLEVLGERMEGGGPLHLVRLAGGWQLATRPEYAPLVGAFLKPQAGRLGRSLLETLAVVAYRQPATVAEIEAVRGVDSSYAIRGLLERGLVIEAGRRRGPGRPAQYATGAQFLHAFGLDSLAGLPPLDEGAAPSLGIGAERAEGR